MRCCVFGVANHAPEDVVSILIKSKLSVKSGDIGILPTQSRVDSNFRYLFILSVLDFSRNRVFLDGSTTKVFIFSNPISLSEYSGIHNLDFVQVDDFTFNFTSIDINRIQKSEPTTITKSKSDFLPKLITSVKFGSLLNPLMTFIYSLSSQNQNIVKHLVVMHMYDSTPKEKLIASLARYLTDRAIDRLLSIITTSVAESYETALSEIKQLRKRKQMVDIKTIVDQTGTSSYELSYMLSIVDNKTKYLDSFDRAKNRKIRADGR